MTNAKSIILQILVTAGTLLLIGGVIVLVRQGFEHNNIVLDWTVLTRSSQYSQGTYLNNVLDGALLTLKVSLVGILLATILGTVIGIARLSSNPVVKWIAGLYVEIFRNTPLLVQLFFWNFAFVTVLPRTIAAPLFALLEKVFSVPFGDAIFAGLGALAVYTSSYIAETVRAGIESIHKGQFEAAASLGLSDAQSLGYVILPQAFRVVFPPLGNQFLNLTKNSSLLHVLGLPELLYSGTQIQNYEGRGFEAITTITLSYLLISLSITAVLHWLKGRLSFPGQH